MESVNCPKADFSCGMMDYDREGQDITASDMIVPEEDSDIETFFNNSTVFITGATGFLGKLALEKLLYICEDVKVFVLIREKDGKSIETRLTDMFNLPIFERLKRTRPHFKDNIHVISGDVSCPNFNIDPTDLKTLIIEVDCIMNFAATKKIDEHIKVSTYTNVASVKHLIHLAKRMKHLKAFLHMSTAFSSLSKKEMNEEFCEAPMSSGKLLSLIECLEDDQLRDVTNTILKNYPNTYIFTKCVAEDCIKSEGQSLPIALFRPSIAIATVKDPVSGWIDDIYGATGALVCASTGILRSLHCEKHYKAELVPADYIINSCLAAMWNVATVKVLNDNKEMENGQNIEIPIYNFVSSVQNPISWDEVRTLAKTHSEQAPSIKMVWYYMFKMRSNYMEHVTAIFLLHTLPAYIIDFVFMCLGRNTSVRKHYAKINQVAEMLSYYATKEWSFKNDNVNDLWQKMKKRDRELFDFDMGALNWDMYFYTCIRGARVYILKDPLATIPQGIRKYYKLMTAHYLILCVCWCIIAYSALFMQNHFSVSIY